MGTHRYIATSFWDDEWVQTLDPSEKLLYLYLMTNPLTNIAGVYKITVRRMSFDTGFSADTLKGVFAKFETAGKAYRMGEYVVLPSWPKHQNWESKENIKAGIEKILDSLSGEELAFVSKIGYKFPLVDMLARRGVKPIPTPVDTTSTPHEPNYSILSNSILSDSKNSCGSSEPPFSEPPIERTENTERLDFPNSQSFSADVSQKEADPSPIESSANHGETLTVGPKIAPRENALVPSRSRSPPSKSKKNDLTPEQLALFHAAKARFESDEKTKAIMFQDPASAAREMKHLKTLAVRCVNIAPEMPSVFLQNVLEHFWIMCQGKYKGDWVFTPHTLVTPWIWNKVIDSLPGPENKRLRELVRGMFD